MVIIFFFIKSKLYAKRSEVEKPHTFAAIELYMFNKKRSNDAFNYFGQKLFYLNLFKKVNPIIII